MCLLTIQRSLSNVIMENGIGVLNKLSGRERTGQQNNLII